MFANERCRAVDLDHGEPSAGGRNGVAFPCVGLLSNPQRVQLGLERASIDDFGRGKFICHDVFHLSLPCYTGFGTSAARFRKAASPASDTSTHFGSGMAAGT